jgi:hypothetical protein
MDVQRANHKFFNFPLYVKEKKLFETVMLSQYYLITFFKLKF